MKPIQFFEIGRFIKVCKLAKVVYFFPIYVTLAVEPDLREIIF